MTAGPVPLAAAGDLDPVLDELRAVTGAGHVITGPLGLSEFLDPYSLFGHGNDPFRPAAAVRPATTGQVQDIVRIAGRHRRPLWPVSTGRNLGYGGPAPAAADAIMLDLRRMDQILEVSDRFAYALVEPGVTYFQLHKFLSEQYPGLWVDVPDLGWGGPVGNTLERGAGSGPAPYADHFAAHCGMEVVLPDSSVIRTGMGALPGSTSWQLYPYGYGPYLDGLFSQGNFGVVTKLGVWLMPRPAGYRPYMITFPREEDLGPVTDIMRPLRIAGVMPNGTVRSLLLEAAFTAARSRYYVGDGPVPAELYPQIMADQDIGAWNLYGAVYGPAGVMDAQLAEIRAAFGEITDARWYFQQDRPPGSFLAHRARRLAGVPGLEDLRILDWAAPQGGHIDISQIGPAAGLDATAQYRLARDLCRLHGQDYLGSITAGGRELRHLVMIVFSRADEARKRHCLELAIRLVAEGAARGWGTDRAHLALMAQVAGTYSFGGHTLMDLVRTLKNAVDPCGILAPGKQGI